MPQKRRWRPDARCCRKHSTHRRSNISSPLATTRSFGLAECCNARASQYQSLGRKLSTITCSTGNIMYILSPEQSLCATTLKEELIAKLQSRAVKADVIG